MELCALRNAKELKSLIDGGIRLLSDDKTQELQGLLTELVEERSQKVPILVPTRRDSYLPQRILVQRLGLLFFTAFGNYLTESIADICNTVRGQEEEFIDARTVRRNLKPVKEHIKALTAIDN